MPGQLNFNSDKWNQQRLLKLLLGPEQILCYIAFTWALLILFAKKAEVIRQSEAFSLNLLSHDPSHRILPEDARLLQRKIADQSRTKRRAVYRRNTPAIPRCRRNPLPRP